MSAVKHNLSVILSVLILLYAKDVVTERIMCPVSSDPGYTARGRFVYPLDIYFAKNDSLLLFSNDKIREATKCYATDGTGSNGEQYEIHLTCPKILPTCPVQQYNVGNMTKMNSKVNNESTTFSTAQFCALKERLSNQKEHIRVLTFGSSVTSGYNSGGCCDDRKECSFFYGHHHADGSPLVKYVHNCAWPNPFGHWMAANNNAKVTFHSFAVPGYSSEMSANDLESFFLKENITTLNKNDLIFVDHSVTDCPLVNTPDGIVNVKLGVSSLVTKLYSLGNVANRDLPLIILIEATNSPLADVQGKLRNAYVDVAKLYRVPLWSMRDGILQGYKQSDGRSHNIAGSNPLLDDRFYDHITQADRKVIGRRDFHPPWHVHLYYADILAATLLNVFKTQCVGGTEGSDGGNDKGTELQLAIAEKKQEIDKQWSYLQLLLSESGTYNNNNNKQGLGKGAMCAAGDHSVLLTYSYENVINKGGFRGAHTIPGKNNLWSVSTDPRGRGGFISILPEDTTCNDHRLVVSEKDDKSHSLFFQYTGTAATNTQLAVNPSAGFLLNIVHLNSYTNMGVVDVYVCGTQVGTIDTLWKDFENFKFSLPQITNIVIPVGMCGGTSGTSSQRRRLLSSEIHGPKNRTDDNQVTTAASIVGSYNNDSSSNPELEINRPRHTPLFEGNHRILTPGTPKRHPPPPSPRTNPTTQQAVSSKVQPKAPHIAPLPNLVQGEIEFRYRPQLQLCNNSNTMGSGETTTENRSNIIGSVGSVSGKNGVGGELLASRKPRLRQMVKIVSVKLCVTK